MKIILLGHKGMLGDAVWKYFSVLKKFEIEICEHRWPTQEFKNNILCSDANFIINCIGKIPQKYPIDQGFQKINFDLPIFLETSGKKILHPSTDCEFNGQLEFGKMYPKKHPRNAVDEYGKSKAEISEKIEKEFKNTKIIRTSIIGHETGTHVALLDWFLSQEDEVNGYSNHFWNGITTLEWAKNAEKIILNWDRCPVLTQLSTDDTLSKFDLLNTIKDVYEKNIQINKFIDKKQVNRCLISDYKIKNIQQQLKELKFFYEK